MGPKKLERCACARETTHLAVGVYLGTARSCVHLALTSSRYVVTSQICTVDIKVAI